MAGGSIVVAMDGHHHMHVPPGLDSPGRHHTFPAGPHTHVLHPSHTSHTPPPAEASQATLHAHACSVDVQPHARRSWRLWLSGVTVLGLRPSPELLAIAMVYFVQGSVGLATLACSYFYKDDLKVEPAQAALLLGLQDFPWWIKPIYGFMSDSIPLCGYRRRSYLVACGAMGAACWFLLAAVVQSTFTATALMTLASASTAFSDVVVDSIVVERSRNAPPETSGSLQSLCWVSNYVGRIASAYFSGHLVDKYGNRFVFGLTAAMPLFVSLSSLLIPERPITRRARASATRAPTSADHPNGAVSLTHYAPVSSSDEGPPDALLRLQAAASFVAREDAHGSSGAASGEAHVAGLDVAGHGHSGGGNSGIGSSSSTSHQPAPPPAAQTVPSQPLRFGRPAAKEEGEEEGAGARSGVRDHGDPRDERDALDLPGAGEGTLLQRLGRQMRSLWGALRQRQILLPTVFIFLWQSTPSSDTAMFYFYSNYLHFSPEFLGWVALAGSCAGLAGVLLYNTCLKSVPLKRMMLWCMVLGAVLGSTQLILVSGLNRKLGMSDELFVLGDNVIITALVNIASMPILVLAARLCPEGVEATLFASLMSVFNAGSSVGSALGAGLTSLLGVTSTNFNHMTLLVGLCNLLALLPLPLLRLLPDDLPPEDGSPLLTPPAQGRDGAPAAMFAGSDADGSGSQARDAEAWPDGAPASEDRWKQGGWGIGMGASQRRAAAAQPARDTEMVQHEQETRGLLAGVDGHSDER